MFLIQTDIIQPFQLTEMEMGRFPKKKQQLQQKYHMD